MIYINTSATMPGFVEIVLAKAYSNYTRLSTYREHGKALSSLWNDGLLKFKPEGFDSGRWTLHLKEPADFNVILPLLKKVFGQRTVFIVNGVRWNAPKEDSSLSFKPLNLEAAR